MPRSRSNSASSGNAAIAPSSALRYAASLAGSPGASSAAICSAARLDVTLDVIRQTSSRRAPAQSRSPAALARACSARCRRSSVRRARAPVADRAAAPGETIAPLRSTRSCAGRRAPDRRNAAPPRSSSPHRRAPRRCRCEASPARSSSSCGIDGNGMQPRAGRDCEVRGEK